MNEPSDLICPFCRGSLTTLPDALRCNACVRRWPLKRDVPFFTDGQRPAPDDTVDSELKRVASVAESAGWKVALFDYSKAKVMKDSNSREDQRRADWQYLVPLSEKTIALDLGCGWGALAISFSQACGAVYAIDSSWEKISFLNARKKQQAIKNLHLIYMRGMPHLPFPENHFDIVSVRDCHRGLTRHVGFSESARQVCRILKPGGTAYFNLGNRLGFQRLLQSGDVGRSRSLHTLYGYRHALRTERFSEIQVYAPLPHHEGTPLFYVPLDDTGIFNHFLRDIFPLLETVSPDSRRPYALEYTVAKIGVRLCRLFRLAGCAKLFLPGFGILAKKAAPRTEAKSAA